MFILNIRYPGTVFRPDSGPAGEATSSSPTSALDGPHGGKPPPARFLGCLRLPGGNAIRRCIKVALELTRGHFWEHSGRSSTP
ncbi:hypothetical protein EYF80_043060 [Liparis tanakae]|uniref:Uncharacterized protein n=1 Tax=Liparis tanakae TaxID=230148 RepID=A0A4Z2FZR8_9TELE|nr:hypothetical protein EYF80_043060 [Liparis tanakae]